MYWKLMFLICNINNIDHINFYKCQINVFLKKKLFLTRPGMGGKKENINTKLDMHYIFPWKKKIRHYICPYPYDDLPPRNHMQCRYLNVWTSDKKEERGTDANLLRIIRYICKQELDLE